MKIALVTLDYPPERGGVARYLGNLVSEAQGTMDVFVNNTHQTTGPGHVEAITMFVSGPFPWWPMIWQMRRLKSRGYDLVFVSHALPVGTAAWIAHLLGGLPYVVLVHGLDLRLAVRSRRKAWLFRRVLSYARLVLANSAFVSQEIKTVVPIVKPRVLTPAVESISFLDRVEARRRCGLSDQDFIILCVTRLVTRKGIDHLIEALKHLPSSIRLVVIGDGQDAARLQILSTTLGLEERVTFLSNAYDEERNAWYAAADIFALPVRDEGNDVEGFGIVYLEAAQAGLPVIAGRSGGAAEAIREGETGVSVDSMNVDEIARAIQTLYDHPDLRERYGRAGKAWVERDFRWSDRWQHLRTWLN